MAKTFDAFAVERPTLKLGPHGEWKLGEITESRRQRIVKLMEATQSADAEDTTITEMARLVGELCAVACVRGDEIPPLLMDLADEDKHGDDAIGVQTLVAIMRFINDYFADELSAGED